VIEVIEAASTFGLSLYPLRFIFAKIPDPKQFIFWS
jgi:hypothetical protein